MNEGQKPFACEIKGCEMTFTNEDHLNWHRKKHDMVLNIGLANKNGEVADQTPTPTRFIRNCEEVGLFQDLQNVNPFDEFFKKAVEVSKSGGTLEVHEINSDDSLHTPHILPHIEECKKKASLNEDDHSNSNEFTLHNVIPIPNNCEQFKVEVTQINGTIVKINEDGKTLDNGVTYSKSKNIDDSNINVYHKEAIQIKDIKMKIKHTLQVRGKQKITPSNLSGNNTVLVDSSQKMKMNSKDFTNDILVPITKEKIRAMNRAAQVRCRKRKAQKWKEMEEQIEYLKKENKRLKIENRILRKNVIVMGNTFINKNSESSIEGTYIIDIKHLCSFNIYLNYCNKQFIVIE